MPETKPKRGNNALERIPDLSISEPDTTKEPSAEITEIRRTIRFSSGNRAMGITAASDSSSNYSKEFEVKLISRTDIDPETYVLAYAGEGISYIEGWSEGRLEERMYIIEGISYTDTWTPEGRRVRRYYTKGIYYTEYYSREGIKIKSIQKLSQNSDAPTKTEQVVVWYLSGSKSVTVNTYNKKDNTLQLAVMRLLDARGHRIYECAFTEGTTHECWYDRAEDGTILKEREVFYTERGEKSVIEIDRIIEIQEDKR